jgi:hypothetical protein
LSAQATPVVDCYVAIVYGHRRFEAEVLPAIQQFWSAVQGLASKSHV